MTTRRAATGVALAAALFGCGAGCGGGSAMRAPGGAATSSAAEEAKSVDSLRTEGDALAAIDRAENELAMLFPAQPGAQPPEAAYAAPPDAERLDAPQPPAPSPAATQASAEAPPKKKAPAVELAAADRDDQQGSSCALACRALGSMQRATERLCELAGAESARCEGAKQRVEAALARVQPVCSDCGS